MSVTEGCEVENITSLVKQHVPKAQLSRQQEAELTFTLPFEGMDTFPGLVSICPYVTICYVPHCHMPCGATDCFMLSPGLWWCFIYLFIFNVDLLSVAFLYEVYDIGAFLVLTV